MRVVTIKGDSGVNFSATSIYNGKWDKLADMRLDVAKPHEVKEIEFSCSLGFAEVCPYKLEHLILGE